MFSSIKMEEYMEPKLSGIFGGKMVAKNKVFGSTGTHFMHMKVNCPKLGLTVGFMKYLASVITLIFLSKTLIWNKITLRLANVLNLAELLVNELTKSIPQKVY